jgi:hypothetical protein
MHPKGYSFIYRSRVTGRCAFLLLPALTALLGAVLCMELAGCGGGGSTGSGNPPPANFNLSLSASTLTLTTSGQNLTVTLNPLNGFSSTATCGLSGIPSGVNVSPASFSVSSGNPQQLQLSENNVASAGTSTVTVSCVSGSLSAQVQFTLTVQVPVTPALGLTSLPASITIYPGNMQIVELGINGMGGVTGSVSGTVTGLPSGVTVAQPTFTSTVNSDVILDFSAASTATTSGSATVTVTNGTLTATANIPITVYYAPDFTLSSGIYTGLGVYQSSTATFSA